MKNFYKSLFLSFLFFFFTLILFAQSAFVENKGQWQKHILYRANLPNGAIFFENNRIVYNLVNNDDIKQSRRHHNYHSSLKSIIRFHAYSVTFVNANKTIPVASEAYSDYENYYIGNNPEYWASFVKRYKRLFWKNLYNGIDYTFYFNDYGQLQYDFIIHPGASAEDIKLAYEGQDTIWINKEGEVVIFTSVGIVNELKPYAYQIIEGKKIDVPCKFLLRGSYLAFQFPEGYNENYSLIVDPVLIFSSYSGSTADNWGFTATFDELGNGYSAGIVFNVGYPVTLGAYQYNYAGGEPANPNYPNYYGVGCDIGIIKYSPNGLQRLWATYLGGAVSEEMPHSMVCNRSNDLIIMGTTGSSDFPTTNSAYDRTFNGGDTTVYDNVIRFSNGTDIFIARLSSDGSQLIASTFIGGSKNDGLNYYGTYMNESIDTNLYYNYADGARGEVICDAQGNIYVGTCTFSNDFPVTANSFGPYYHGKQEGVVFKFDPMLSQLIWSGYFGGSENDAIYSIDIDANNDIYIAGGTRSVNIPTTSGVWKPLAPTMYKTNGFVAHINSNGTSIINSTYVGSTEYDQVYFVRVDKQKNVYVTGQTKASGNYYIINASYGVPSSGQFIIKFPNSLSSPIWSTAFGTGNQIINISFTAFAVDLCNRVYVSGWGRNWNLVPNEGTYNLPTTPNAYQTNTDGMDFYLLVLSDDASHLEYATFFGEINTGNGYCGHDHVDGGTSRFDKRGNIYQSVCASCGNGCNGFPTYPNPGVWSPNNGGMAHPNEWVCNNALFKFSFALPLTVADFLPVSGCLNTPIQFTNTSQLATEYFWDFGDGSTSTDVNPVHTYTNPGYYNVTLIANNPTSCNIADTITRTVYIEQLTSNTTNVNVCFGESALITVNVNGSSGQLHYYWDNNNPIDDTLNSNTSNPSFIVTPQQSTYYYVLATDGICSIIDSVFVNVHQILLNTSPDTIICSGTQINIFVNVHQPSGNETYQWQPTSSIISGSTTNNPLINPSSSTTYYVTVTDQNGCTAKDSILVEVDLFNATIDNIAPIRCHNDCNGQISISIQDAYLPVSYLWNNGQTSSTATNLCEGNYSVTVQDNVGCSKILQASLTNPPPLSASIQILSPASCDMQHPNTGSISVTAWGGTPNYHFHWNTGDTTTLLQNLFVGTYYVTITDEQGCDTILSATINDPSPLQITVTQSPTLCYGSCDGAAQVYITQQGTPPYQYIWNTNEQTTQINHLCSGVYTVTVTDAEYCVRIQSIYVQQPDSIRPILQITPIKCHGDTTSITITNIIGGTPSYTYIWNNGSTSNAIHGIEAGSYYLVITDAHHCIDTTYINLTQPDLLLLNQSITQPLCYVACNGSILLTPSGGTIPYYYHWSNGSTTQAIHNLCDNNYSVTVTDANGCSIVQTYHIENQQYTPSLIATANPSVIFIGQTTQLNAITNANYITWSPTYGVSNPHITNPTAKPDSNTFYIVEVTDIWGCKAIDTVWINVVDFVCGDVYIYVPNAFTPNGDGNNDILYVRGGMITDLYFAIYDRWGEKIFETTDLNKGWDGTYRGKPLDPAVFVYYLHVTCLDRKQFEKKGNITLLR